MRALLTGVSGQVGAGVARALRGECQLRLLDIKRPDNDYGEFIQASLLDADALAGAVEGMEAVVNLAVARKSAKCEPTTDDFFDVNVKGLYMLLEAAREAGVKRFVHVSSTATVIGHWYAGRRISVSSPYTTRGRYSLTKALQELLCEHFSRNSSVRITALRLWSPCDAESVYARARSGENVYAPGLIDTEDFGRACLAAMEADGLDPFTIFHCVATPEAVGRFDAERTERLLGWRARVNFADLSPDIDSRTSA